MRMLDGDNCRAERRPGAELEILSWKSGTRSSERAATTPEASLALGLTAAHRHQDGASGTGARMIEVVDLSANVQINNTELFVRNKPTVSNMWVGKPWPSQTSTHPALAGSVQ